jgi:predicted phosphohydrolase
MSLFAIADLHLSFGANKPMDIFPGWDNYTEKIEKNWRKVVKPEDTVVIAGDVSWAMSLNELSSDFDFLQSLPGHKLIIKGNHDYWWDTMSKMVKFVTNGDYDSISFIHNSAKIVGGVGVCGTRGWFNDGSEDKKILMREVGRLETSIGKAEKAGVTPVVFLHYPPICGGYYCDEIMDVLKRHGVSRCYYGHLHGRATETAIEGTHEGIIFRLISCDHTAFAPVIVENYID